MKYPQV
jgi:hypothetical protein